MANKPVVVDDTYKKKIEELAHDFGMQQKELIHSMVDFLVRTGIDPRETRRQTINKHLQNIEKLIKNTDNRIISFIKQQEKTQLKSILENLEIVVKKQYEYSDVFVNIAEKLDNFDGEYVGAIKKMNENQKKLNDNIVKIAEFLDNQ